MVATMSQVSRRLHGLLTLIVGVTILLIFVPIVRVASISDCPTGFVNFGGSYTDTGNFESVSPYSTNAENPPYGQTFFGNPSKRFCNGRVVPDFFALAFRKPLLDPYVKATSFQYQFGINFAEEGATAVPADPNPNTFGNQPAQPKNIASVYPVQLNQFKRFLNSVVTTESEPSCGNFSTSLPQPIGTSWVSQWLYMIEGGANDLLNVIRTNPNNYQLGQSSQYIENVLIPRISNGIIQTIQGLYQIGVQKFLVFGIPALGCSTEVLTLFSNNDGTYPAGTDTDSYGCLIYVNEFASDTNAYLLQKIQQLRPTLPAANIAFFDYYAANMQILKTPTAFAFSNTLSACCGASGRGTRNYNPGIICGSSGATVCATPGSYVNWDGEHYTDLFYKIISIFALYGVFTDGGINYATSGCFLDFTKFTDDFSFNQVYPSACQTIFV